VGQAPKRTATGTRFGIYYRLFRKNAATVLSGLQVISIILGGIYFLYQYSDNLDTARKKETLTYVSKSLDKELAGTQFDLDRPFQSPALKPEFDKVLREAFKSGDICPAQALYREKFLGAYFSNATERAGFYSKLSSRLRFFESLAICVNSKTCDPDTACAYFFDDAKTLITDNCIEFDRYTLQFGESPARETEKFLRACVTAAKDTLDSLTYCEGIRKRAAELQHWTGNSKAKQLAAFYKNCPYDAPNVVMPANQNPK
jgi:hypothetical protein